MVQDKLEEAINEALKNASFEGSEEKVYEFGNFYFYAHDRREYVGDKLPPAYLEGYFVPHSEEHLDDFLEKIKGKNIFFEVFDTKYTFSIKEYRDDDFIFKIEDLSYKEEEKVEEDDDFSTKINKVKKDIAELYAMACYENDYDYEMEEFIRGFLL